MTAFYQKKWSSIGIYPGKSSGSTVVGRQKGGTDRGQLFRYAAFGGAFDRRYEEVFTPAGEFRLRRLERLWDAVL